jgi:hypothetical protein
MNRSNKSTTLIILWIVIYSFLSGAAFGQADIAKSEGITSPLHQANIGKITFMSKLIPVENYKETEDL